MEVEKSQPHLSLPRLHVIRQRLPYSSIHTLIKPRLYANPYVMCSEGQEDELPTSVTLINWPSLFSLTKVSYIYHWGSLLTLKHKSEEKNQTNQICPTAQIVVTFSACCGKILVTLRQHKSVHHPYAISYRPNLLFSNVSSWGWTWFCYQFSFASIKNGLKFATNHKTWQNGNIGYHYYLTEEQRTEYGSEEAGVMANPDFNMT